MNDMAKQDGVYWGSVDVLFRSIIYQRQYVPLPIFQQMILSIHAFHTAHVAFLLFEVQSVIEMALDLLTLVTSDIYYFAYGTSMLTKKKLNAVHNTPIPRLTREIGS